MLCGIFWRRNPFGLNDKHWICGHVQRWVRAFYDDIIHANVTTTNGLERQHEELKYNYLGKHSSGSLTDLVTTVVTKLVPESQSKFVFHVAHYQSLFAADN